MKKVEKIDKTKRKRDEQDGVAEQLERLPSLTTPARKLTSDKRSLFAQKCFALNRSSTVLVVLLLLLYKCMPCVVLEIKYL